MNTSVIHLSDASGHFHTIDYAVFGSLLLLSVSIGVYFGFFDGTEQSTEEYLMGGRKMKPIPVAISLVASQLSAFTFISIPSEIYSYGSHYMIMDIPCVIFMNFMVNYGVLPVFYENDIVNCYAYLELRFGKAIRSLITAMFMLAILMFLPITSFLPAIAFAQATGLNIHMINALVIFVCVSYTMLGGVKAVIWTDVVQAFVMVFSIGTVLVFAFTSVGGVREVFERAIDGDRLSMPPFVLDLTTRQTFWNLGLSLTLNWVFYIAFNQSCLQRLAALPSLKDAKKTMVMFCIGVIIIKTTTCLIGLAMYAYYRDCDPIAAGILTQADKMVPYFVSNIIGHIPGMPGIFISCVFSASLSTVSAILNSTSGILYTDYISQIPNFKHTERKANVIMRSMIVLIGLYCIVLGFAVEKSTSLFQMQFTLASLSGGVIFGVFTLALFYPPASHKGAVCGSIVSIVLMALFITSAQLYNAVYGTSFQPLPSSTDGCSAMNITTITPSIPNLTSATTDSPHADRFTSIFQTSFVWYSFFSTLIVWFVSITLSHTIAPNRKRLDAGLISPWVRWACSENGQHMEMSTISVTKINDADNISTDRRVLDERVYVVK